MFFAGSGVSALTGFWSNCMNTRFQYSRKRSFSPPGRSSGLPNSRPRSRYSSEHGPHGPVGPICQKFSERGHSTIRSRGTPTSSHASIASSSGPRPSSSSPANTVIQMSLERNPNPSRESSQAYAHGLALEVVAEREVAEHLEERQMARGRADDVDVGGAERLLAAWSRADAAGARVPRKYGFSGTMPAIVNSTDGSCSAGISDADGSRWWSRCTKNSSERAPDLVGGHRASVSPIVPHPTTSSPSIRHASWPGAAPSTVLVELARSSRAWRPAGGSPGSAPGADGAVAELDPVDPRAGRCSRTPRTRHARGAQRRRGGRRRPGCWPRPCRARTAARRPRRRCPALADGELCWPRCGPTTSPARSTSSPARSPSPPWRARKRARSVPARKQRSCESALAATGRPAACADPPDLGLRQLPERKPHPRQRARLAARPACTSGPWRDRRPRAAAGRRRHPAQRCARSGRWPAVRTRADRRARASRRAARARCSPRTGWASRPPRSRR